VSDIEMHRGENYYWLTTENKDFLRWKYGEGKSNYKAACLEMI